LREPRRRARGSCPRKRAPFNDSIVNPQPGRFTAAGPGEGRRGTTDPRRMRRARQGSNAHRGACLVEPQLAQGPPPVPMPGRPSTGCFSLSLWVGIPSPSQLATKPLSHTRPSATLVCIYYLRMYVSVFVMNVPVSTVLGGSSTPLTKERMGVLNGRTDGPCRFPSPAYARWEPLATKAPFLSREGSAPTRCDSSVLPCMHARCQPSIPARARARSRGRARVQVHVRSTV